MSLRKPICLVNFSQFVSDIISSQIPLPPSSAMSAFAQPPSLSRVSFVSLFNDPLILNNLFKKNTIFDKIY